MSTLHTNTVETSSGGAVTLTKQAALKCFFKTTGTYTSVAAGALNVSSVSDIGTGDVDVLFTNAFAATTEVVVSGTVETNGGKMCSVTGIATTQISLVCHSHDGSDVDNEMHGMVTGDLA